jgi:hypothetical protein
MAAERRSACVAGVSDAAAGPAQRRTRRPKHRPALQQLQQDEEREDGKRERQAWQLNRWLFGLRDGGCNGGHRGGQQRRAP